jgi:DNA-binding MarR family transcriptional regulator
MSAAKMTRTRGCGSDDAGPAGEVIDRDDSNDPQLLRSASKSCDTGAVERDAPELPARILDELGRLVRQLSRVSGGPDDGTPMTGTQRIALIEISDAGPLRLNDLAERMGVSAPTASRAVDALEELELVERLPDPDDRRAVRIDLTAGGRRRVAARKRRVVETFGPAVSTLDQQEQERLVELLVRLRSALAPDIDERREP